MLRTRRPSDDNHGGKTTGRDGFTLVEVLVTVAALIIILGLMANLARSVRRQASDRQTKFLLTTLDRLLDKYVARNGRLPRVSPFPPAGSVEALPDEPQLREAARANNRDVVAAVRTEAGPTVDIFGPVGGDNGGAPGYDRLPDAWGRDIVFMPRGHPAIGTALEDRPFFFSAGPDGRYQTLEDNVYSYEIAPTAANAAAADRSPPIAE